MRKNKFLVMLLLGVMAVSFLASCDDDDKPEDEHIPLSEIISNHKWFLDSKHQITKPELDLNGDGKIDSEDRDLSPQGADADDTYSFKKDGVFERNSFNEVSPGEEQHTVLVRGTWKIEGNKLIIKETGGDVIEFRILPITRTKIGMKSFSVIEKNKKGDSEYEIQYTYTKELEKK